jgi:FtsH-binding integral membrane protein
MRTLLQVLVVILTSLLLLPQVSGRNATPLCYTSSPYPQSSLNDDRLHSRGTPINPLPILLLSQRLRGGSSAAPFRPPSRIQPFGTRSSNIQGSFTSNDPSSAEAAEKESVKEMIDAFLTRDSRNTFIARVYAILSLQLSFTAGVCILFNIYPPLKNISAVSHTGQYTNSLVIIPLLGILLSTVAWFRMAVIPEARQKSPNKFWWCAAFTLGEALSLGCLSSMFKLKSVILSMVATAIATIVVSAYTVLQNNSKYDLSQWGVTLSS